MADVETPIVTEESRLATTRTTGSLLERWIEGTPELALKKLETLSQVLERMRLAAIQQTYPTDWVIHTTVDRASGEVAKQVGYLQDSGAERAGKIFGIEVGKVTVEREEFPEDGTLAYHMTASAWSKLTGEHIDEAIGSRWSGDPFFARQVDRDAGERVDPVDVRKAAYANLHGRAVRSLTGLTAVPLDRLQAAGLVTSRCMFVAYQGGAKGGQSAGATVGSADVLMPWGNGKGKKPSELEDKDLSYYLEAVTKSLADPDKAKFKKSNERLLAALTAERERRAQAKEHEEATGTKAPAAAGPGDGEATGAGKKRGDLWAMLQEIANKKAMPVLKQVAKDQLAREISGPSDLTEEADLDALLKVPRAIYAEVLKALDAPKGK